MDELVFFEIFNDTVKFHMLTSILPLVVIKSN